MGSLRASRKLHAQLLERVMRLPMSFFDSQPSGRLLNRFTKDTEAADTEILVGAYQWHDIKNALSYVHGLRERLIIGRCEEIDSHLNTSSFEAIDMAQQLVHAAMDAL